MKVCELINYLKEEDPDLELAFCTGIDSEVFEILSIYPGAVEEDTLWVDLGGKE